MHFTHLRRTLRLLLLAALGTMLGGCATRADDPPASGAEHRSAARVHYKTIEVRGIRIFYREAGDPGKPTLLLLHGFPSSSHMYRELIPRLAEDFHLVAPDYPGAGFSEHPSPEKFSATFDGLAELMSAFVSQLGLQSYMLYMQDFGGPVGFRMALENPDAVRGIVIQNANAYLEGIAPDQLEGMRQRASGLTAAGRAQVAQLVSREFTLFNYQTGSRNFGAIDPTGWNLDALLLAQPEIQRIQTSLMLDYYSNVIDYPKWQAYLRSRQPRTLIVWGRNDPIFLPPGAQAYLRDVPGARLRFLDTGHFALEEDVQAIADEIRGTFAGANRPPTR